MSVRFLALATLLVTACAAPCKRVTAHHAEFLARAAVSETPHVSLAVPLATVDRLIATEVKRLPRLKQRLPSIAGVSLGTVGLRVEKVTTRPAPAGKLRFTIRVGLSRGKHRLLGVDIDAVVRPVIDPRARKATVVLHGKNIVSLKPALGPGSADSIAAAVWRELPRVAKAFTSKKKIAKLARGVGNDIMRQAFKLVKRDLLPDIGEITRIELALPDLPLSRIELRTTPRDAVLVGWTSLPVGAGLKTEGRGAGTPAGAPQLRISGETAAELGNYAMEIGEIPRRWGLDGKPDPSGSLHAALGWQSGQKPLHIHLWRLEDDCAHVRMAARPGVSVKGRDLVLRADDARVADVDGALKVRAAVWFGGLGRQSFSFVERTAARVSFRVGGQVMTASVSQARLADDELTLALTLTARRR